MFDFSIPPELDDLCMRVATFIRQEVTPEERAASQSGGEE